MDLDRNKDVPVRVAAGRRFPHVGFDREPSGRAPLRELGPGYLFGELALLSEDVRTASVTAVTRVR